MKNKTFQEKLAEILEYVYNSGRISEWKLSDTKPGEIPKWLNANQAQQAITALIESDLIGSDHKRELQDDPGFDSFCVSCGTYLSDYDSCNCDILNEQLHKQRSILHDTGEKR